MRLTAERGVASLSMSALAEEAGVSRQTLYSYFADVEAVLAGLVEAGGAGDAELAARLDEEQDTQRALHLFVEAVVAAAAAGHPSPATLGQALPASLREAIGQHERTAERLLVDVLRRGCQQGHFRDDLEPELDGRLLYRMIISGADLATEPDADVAALGEHLAANVERMVTR